MCQICMTDAYVLRTARALASVPPQLQLPPLVPRGLRTVSPLAIGGLLTGSFELPHVACLHVDIKRCDFYDYRSESETDLIKQPILLAQ